MASLGRNGFEQFFEENLTKENLTLILSLTVTDIKTLNVLKH
jgi:hypothetical protein